MDEQTESAAAQGIASLRVVAQRYLDDNQPAVSAGIAMQADAIERALDRLATFERRESEEQEREPDVQKCSQGHSWQRRQAGMPQCERCRHKATQAAIRHGAVPTCDRELGRCRASFSKAGQHEVTFDYGQGSCVMCETIFPALW